jgi:hypothetical protein
MTAEERDKRIRALFEEDMKLLTRKGHDYSGDDDCLRNFRDFGWFGILVRLSDKFSRLKNLAKNRDSRVDDESFLDTLRDIRNYAYLLQVVMEEASEKNTLHTSDHPFHSSQYHVWKKDDEQDKT